MPQYYIHNHHPVIIPPNIFDRLQEDIENRPPNIDKRSRSYIFSKRLLCPYCGAYYGQIIWNKGTQKEVVVWKCNNKFKDENRCPSPTLKESYIKDQFIKEINSLITNKEQIIKNLSKLIPNTPKINPIIQG